MDAPEIIAGRFRIECEIGRGGMGTVYRATHIGLARPVAVKILKQEFADYPEVTERFMREARTMARLHHPRAAIIFDAGRLADGRPFIVMEYVEGATLADVLAREKPFTPERAVRIASEICDVLSEAHRLGIVHRDLKPSNIMMSERGVCVLDFGIAKVLATSNDSTRINTITDSGMIVGTPRYMSPEQCVGQTIGPASDLYSVGVLLYEMLTGRPPFVDALASAVLVKQATAPPTPLPRLRNDVPRPLALAVHSLLAKNPSDRPKSAALTRALLERAIAPPSVASQTMPFASTIAILNANRRPAFSRAAATLAVLAIFGALLFAWAQNSRRAEASLLQENSLAVRSNDSLVQSAGQAFVPPLSPDAARRIAATIARGSVSETRILRTSRGEAVAAIINNRKSDQTHLYIIERRGARYRVASRASLNAVGWQSTKWMTEAVDTDGDGFDEVLCTSVKEKGDKGNRRFVLYVPRTEKTYSLQVTPDSGKAKTMRARLSSNASTQKAAPYRATLLQRARSSIALSKNAML